MKRKSPAKTSEEVVLRLVKKLIALTGLEGLLDATALLAVIAAKAPHGKDWLSGASTARLAAYDLNLASGLIVDAAERRDRQFFIELGKCLSAEESVVDHYDRLDFAIAKTVLKNPVIKAKDAVCELRKLGCHAITEENFRMRKKRLGLTNANSFYVAIINRATGKITVRRGKPANIVKGL